MALFRITLTLFFGVTWTRDTCSLWFVPSGHSARTSNAHQHCHECGVLTTRQTMSTALAQSATELTIDTHGEANFDFALHAKTAAQKQAKNLTRERWTLNRQKLIAQVCAVYRATFAAIYGKTERLPSAVFEKIERAVDELIDKQLSAVNRANSVSMRRAFAHKANDMKFVERVVVTGENELSLQEQHLGATIAITQANRRLDELMRKPTPDYDREKATRLMIAKLELTKSFIEGEIKHQAEALPKG